MTSAAIPDNMQAWARRNGCDSTPEQTQFYAAQGGKGNQTNQVWSKCRGGATVELVTNQGGVHHWPTDPTNLYFDTTTHILKFFGLSAENQNETNEQSNGCCQRTETDDTCADWEYEYGECIKLNGRTIGCNRAVWKENSQYNPTTGRCEGHSGEEQEGHDQIIKYLRKTTK